MPTVLLIDDDATLLAQLAAQLGAAGYRTLQASDARFAEHLFGEEPVDLVLIDPGIDGGWALLERLADRSPVIAVGDGREEMVIRGLNAGAVDYVAKPARSAELLARVRGRVRATPPEPPSVSTTTPLVLPPGLSDPADVLSEPPEAESPPPRRSKREEEEEARVFVSHAEEARLINEERGSRVDELDRSTLERMPLGERLKSARQRRRITLVQAELDTRLRMYYIQAMEEEKFALLPRGPMTETMIRTYAAYLGLDGAQAAEEFRRSHYSEPIEPLTALGGVPVPRRLPRWIPVAAAVLLALLVGGGGIWLIDPGGVSSLAARARALVVPPTATATPTVTPTPSPTLTPSPSPTLTPSPTATATRTPPPTATPEPTPEPSATPAPQRPRPTAPPPTPEPPTPEPPTPEPPTPEPPTPQP